MGQLRQRGRIWWIRYYKDGKRFEQSAETTKRHDAERLLKLKEGDVAKGLPVLPRLDRMRFDEAAADLLTEYEANRRKSIGGVRLRISKGLMPFFGGRRMAHITTADVNAYVAERQKAGAANATINRELAALKRMFTLARRAGKLLAAPYIAMLEEDNARQGFFEREQFEAVRRHLPAAVRPVITFAYLTGWRIPSEVLTLQWHQVDFVAAVVRLNVGTTKNGDGRTFPFGSLPELRELLEAQQAATKAAEKATGRIVPWVFHRKGSQVRFFRRSWITACERAGCPGRIPHDLRRTAVRNLVRHGVPERVAMMLSGHKTRSVFERYNVVSERDLNESVQKLAGTISGTIDAPEPVRAVGTFGKSRKVGGQGRDRTADTAIFRLPTARTK
jgi:integrase